MNEELFEFNGIAFPHVIVDDNSIGIGEFLSDFTRIQL
jgi:hypothetical protein